MSFKCLSQFKTLLSSTKFISHTYQPRSKALFCRFSFFTRVSVFGSLGAYEGFSFGVLCRKSLQLHYFHTVIVFLFLFLTFCKCRSDPKELFTCEEYNASLCFVLLLVFLVRLKPRIAEREIRLRYLERHGHIIRLPV